MSRRSRTAALVVLALTALLLVLGLLGRGRYGDSPVARHQEDPGMPDQRRETPFDHSEQSASSASRAGPAGKAPSLHTHRPGSRTLVPRLTASMPAPAFEEGATRHPRRLNRGGDGPRDRRPGARRPDSEAIRRALTAKLDEAMEAAQSCLESWAEQDDSLDSGVMLAFSIDSRGLDQVWIKDREGVPGGALACIANSVYPIDWSGITSEPLEVTVPFRYEARDSG